MDRQDLIDPHKRIRWDNLYSLMTELQQRHYPKSRQIKQFIEDLTRTYNGSNVSWDMPREDVCFFCLGTGIMDRNHHHVIDYTTH